MNCPPGDFSSSPWFDVKELKDLLGAVTDLNAKYISEIWVGDHGVHFNKDNVVTYSAFWDTTPAGFLPRLRAWVARMTCSQ